MISRSANCLNPSFMFTRAITGFRLVCFVSSLWGSVCGQRERLLLGGHWNRLPTSCMDIHVHFDADLFLRTIVPSAVTIAFMVSFSITSEFRGHSGRRNPDFRRSFNHVRSPADVWRRSGTWPDSREYERSLKREIEYSNVWLTLVKVRHVLLFTNSNCILI